MCANSKQSSRCSSAAPPPRCTSRARLPLGVNPPDTARPRASARGPQPRAARPSPPARQRPRALPHAPPPWQAPPPPRAPTRWRGAAAHGRAPLVAAAQRRVALLASRRVAPPTQAPRPAHAPPLSIARAPSRRATPPLSTAGRPRATLARVAAVRRAAARRRPRSSEPLAKPCYRRRPGSPLAAPRSAQQAPVVARHPRA